MKNLFVYVLAALLWPLELIARARRAWADHRDGVRYAANIAEGVHEAATTRLTDAAITTRHLLYRRGSDDGHVAAAGASDAVAPMGTVDDEAAAAEERVAVQILGKGATKRMVAVEAIAVGDEVWTAAGGKVQDRTITAGTYWIVGVALTASAADNDLIEVADCAPVRITIV